MVLGDQWQQVSWLALADGLRAPAAGAMAPTSINVRTAKPYLRDQTSVVQVRWTTEGAAADAPPTLDGSLELAPDQPGSCRLVLVGTLHPPGRSAPDFNHTEMVASATADSLLKRIAEVIAPDPAP